MKRCPKCSRTFPDENQKFCTIDGGLLRTEEPNFDPNLTVRATSIELTPPAGPSEAPTSVRLPAVAETVDEFGSSTFRETPTGPTGTPTSSDLVSPVQSAPTSADLRASAPASTVALQPASGALPAKSPPSGTLAQPAQPAKKRSVLPWIIGGVLILLLLLGGGAVAAGYFFWLKPRMEANRRPVVVERDTTNENSNTAASPSNTNSAVNTNANASASEESKKEVEPFVPSSDAVQFTSAKTDLDGDLADHFVGFSFYYPRSWTKDPTAGVRGASSFAKVQRQLSDQTGDYIQERVVISWYPSNGTYDADLATFPERAKTVSDQIAKSLTNYEEVSKGETTVNAYKGYEFRFKGVFKNTGKGDLPYWGRAILLPPDDASQKNGITILMLVTSLAPGVSGTDDVGVKGELPLILDSFRFAPNR